MNIHRPWYRLEAQQEYDSGHYSFVQQFPQRIGRILSGYCSISFRIHPLDIGWAVVKMYLVCTLFETTNIRLAS